MLELKGPERTVQWGKGDGDTMIYCVPVGAQVSIDVTPVYIVPRNLLAII